MRKLLLSLLFAGGLFTQMGFAEDSFVIVSAGLNGMPSETMMEISYGIEAGKNFYNGQNYLGFLSLGLSALGTPSMKPLAVGLPFVQMVPYLMLTYGYEFMRNNVVSFGLDVSYGVGWMSDQFYSVNNIGPFGKWNLDRFSVLLRAGLCGHKKGISFNTNFGPYGHLGLQYDF